MTTSTTELASAPEYGILGHAFSAAQTSIALLTADTNDAGRIICANSSLVALVDCRSDDLPGTPLTDIIAVALRGQQQQRFDRVARRGGPILAASQLLRVDRTAVGVEVAATLLLPRGARPSILCEIHAERSLPDETLHGENGLVLDTATRRTEVRGETLMLTRREFDSLALLLRARGRVVPTRQLVEAVWGVELGHSHNFVEAMISRLRKKLRGAGCPDAISNVRGIGYAASRRKLAAGAGGRGATPPACTTHPPMRAAPATTEARSSAETRRDRGLRLSSP
jgi:DNA-binding response OmpR family regulator